MLFYFTVEIIDFQFILLIYEMYSTEVMLFLILDWKVKLILDRFWLEEDFILVCHPYLTQFCFKWFVPYVEVSLLQGMLNCMGSQA